MSGKSPMCPLCGTVVMCQKFDERVVNGRTLATPNGTYWCAKCGYETKPEAVMPDQPTDAGKDRTR